ncbi:MAG: low specificity L-threonine aldolase [Candidatus Omnitrophica bacterium]|nr:low specificity L-threonine aldolase [Candidatus Omnitrophota bacterium]
MPQTDKYQFASDNCSGICPEAWEYLERANQGFAPGYGDDEWTQKASDLIREIFETDCSIYFCFTGTAANSMAIGHLCRSYHSVLCHRYAHLETDECGGPEFFTNGTKVLLVDGEEGRLTAEGIQRMIERRSDIHYPKPRVVSLTQSTEFGTVYTPEKLMAIHDACERNDLRLHMDGARFANAVASLGVAPKEVTWKAGVDVLCFGGTKNGMPLGEAVVFFNRDLAEEFDYRCKQAGQLASKMRFIAAPLYGLLLDGVWLKNARHANDCANIMAQRIEEFSGCSIRHPVQSNSVFADFPECVETGLLGRGWHFYNFIGEGGSRLMCSWNTSKEDIDSFLEDVRELVA